MPDHQYIQKIHELQLSGIPLIRRFLGRTDMCGYARVLGIRLLLSFSKCLRCDSVTGLENSSTETQVQTLPCDTRPYEWSFHPSKILPLS